jgi:hypothetical protein
MIFFRLTSLYKLLFLKLCIFLILLSSCGSSTPLNSERIAQRYGNYGIEILFAGDQNRISSLYSESDGRKTMRTLALVEFTAADAPEIANEHGQVLGGGSIGAVFKEAGWTIDKTSSRYCLSKTDLKSLPELERMGIPHPTVLATRIYVFHVRKGTVSIEYATITEIYHPDYLQVDESLDDC